MRPFGAERRMPLGCFSTTAPNCRQRVEVEVDRAVTDAASAEVGDERLAKAMQQRTAEQDRDADGPRARRSPRSAPTRPRWGRARASPARRPPSRRRRAPRAATSRRRHRRCPARRAGCSWSRPAEATIALVAMFFAPLTSTRPRSGRPAADREDGSGRDRLLVKVSVAHGCRLPARPSSSSACPRCRLPQDSASSRLSPRGTVAPGPPASCPADRAQRRPPRLAAALNCAILSSLRSVSPDAYRVPSRSRHLV